MRKRKKIKKHVNKWFQSLVVCLLVFFFMMPLVLTFTNSFMSESEIASNYGMIFSSSGMSYVAEQVNLKWIPDMVTLSQYVSVLLKNVSYLQKFWNSVFLVVPITIFQIAIASLTAYGFTRTKGRITQIIFFVYIVVLLMPYQVTSVSNYMVANGLNLKNTYWSIWLPGIFSPFSVYLLTKYMKRVPKTIVESAQIDGAGEWQIFKSIMMPLCRGQIYSCLILVFIDYWNMVEQPLIMLEDTDVYPLSVFLSKIQSDNIGIAFAASVVYMIPVLLLYLYGEDYVLEGIASQADTK